MIDLRAPLVLVLLGGCIMAQPKVPRDGEPERASGYVGGVFGRSIGSNVGFRLQNERSKETYILAIDDDAMSLIAVPPGRYHVESWLVWGAGNASVTTENAFADSEPIRRSFDVLPRQVKLLGEWHADFNPGANAYSLTPIEINARTALRMFRQAYPRFADVQAKCLYCVD